MATVVGKIICLTMTTVDNAVIIIIFFKNLKILKNFKNLKNFKILENFMNYGYSCRKDHLPDYDDNAVIIIIFF